MPPPPPLRSTICRVERSDFDFNLHVPLPTEPDANAASMRRQEVITVSRKKYATARADVEAMLTAARETVPPVEKAATSIPKQVSPKKAEPAAPPLPPVVAPEPSLSEKVPDVLQIPAKPVPTAKYDAPRDLGRGGAQHQAIQKRVKQAAEELGFRSVIEKPVLDGAGSVDLWLERVDCTIACEISISTTIDHEVGNVNKCLKAGFLNVAVICLDQDRLRKIRTAVLGSLGAELGAGVAYYEPDAFIAHLKALKPPTPQPSETEYGGYKIKRTVPKLSPQEQRQKEDIANRIMAEAMRRKK